MRRYYIERKSMIVAGTAILGAVVAVLEMSRFLRIPFPLLPFLKFDVVGIPMFLTYLFFGLLPSVATCLISFAIISFRSPFSGSMKGLAEFATILGAYIILRGKNENASYKTKAFAMVSGTILRVVVMAFANVLFLPVFYPKYYTTQTAIVILPLICFFNAIQGVLSVLGGFLVHEAVTRRLPSLRA